MSDPVVPAAERSRWNWMRTNQTQRTLLDAALELFIENGYAGTSVEDIVQRSNLSIGSLYHHFGNKAGLYLALWQEWVKDQENLVSTAIEDLQSRGEAGTVPLCMVGARAYLEGCWNHRSRGSVFFAQDGPPGFELRLRNGRHEWLRQVTVLTHASDDPLGRLTVSVMMAIVAEGAQEVVTSGSRADADEIMDATLLMIERVGASDTGDAVADTPAEASAS